MCTTSLVDELSDFIGALLPMLLSHWQHKYLEIFPRNRLCMAMLCHCRHCAKHSLHAIEKKQRSSERKYPFLLIISICSVCSLRVLILCECLRLWVCGNAKAAQSRPWIRFGSRQGGVLPSATANSGLLRTHSQIWFNFQFIDLPNPIQICFSTSALCRTLIVWGTQEHSRTFKNYVQCLPGDAGLLPEPKLPLFERCNLRRSSGASFCTLQGEQESKEKLPMQGQRNETKTAKTTETWAAQLLVLAKLRRLTKQLLINDVLTTTKKTFSKLLDASPQRARPTKTLRLI